MPRHSPSCDVKAAPHLAGQHQNEVWVYDQGWFTKDIGL